MSETKLDRQVHTTIRRDRIYDDHSKLRFTGSEWNALLRAVEVALWVWDTSGGCGQEMRALRRVAIKSRQLMPHGDVDYDWPITELPELKRLLRRVGVPIEPEDWQDENFEDKDEDEE
jgi:hypothetical protein